MLGTLMDDYRLSTIGNCAYKPRPRGVRMATVAFYSEVYEPLAWRQALLACDPELIFQVWNEVTAPEDVDVVLAWRLPEGMLKKLPNLKLLQCLGAGFDQLRGRADLDGEFQIARIVDDDQ